MIPRNSVQKLLDETNSTLDWIKGEDVPDIYLVYTSRAEALRDVLALPGGQQETGSVTSTGEHGGVIPRNSVQKLLDEVTRELEEIKGKDVPSIHRVLTSRAEALRDVLALPGQPQETGTVTSTGEHGGVTQRPDASPASEGISAILKARQAIADGLVRIPDGDLIIQAMWHLAAEGVSPRLERLALAGALVAMEIDKMPDGEDKP